MVMECALVNLLAVPRVLSGALRISRRPLRVIAVVASGPLTGDRRQAGVTLVELMATVAVLAITASIAIPSFSEMVKNNRITTASNELLTTLTLARSAAITNRTVAVVCPSNNPFADQPACGGTWTNGWIAFVDLNGNGVPNPPAEEILEQHGPQSGQVTINAAAGLGQRVQFQPIGTARGSNGRFSICDDRAGEESKRGNMRQVVLAFAGRARVLPGDGDLACA